MEKTNLDEILELINEQTYDERIEFAGYILSILDEYSQNNYSAPTLFSVDDIARMFSE